MVANADTSRLPVSGGGADCSTTTVSVSVSESGASSAPAFRAWKASTSAIAPVRHRHVVDRARSHAAAPRAGALARGRVVDLAVDGGRFDMMTSRACVPCEVG